MSRITNLSEKEKVEEIKQLKARVKELESQIETFRSLLKEYK